jgi:hypothetical protein
VTGEPKYTESEDNYSNYATRKQGYILKDIKKRVFFLVERVGRKNTVFAIGEDAAFRRSMQPFANPYYYFDQNKSIA